jgi:hypothetical protein
MEDEDGGMTKVETACEWMYEFCSRHGMDDAMQGRFAALPNFGGTDRRKERAQQALSLVFRFSDILGSLILEPHTAVVDWVVNGLQLKFPHTCVCACPCVCAFLLEVQHERSMFWAVHINFLLEGPSQFVLF